jgi:hypothetical protein
MFECRQMVASSNFGQSPSLMVSILHIADALESLLDFETRADLYRGKLRSSQAQCSNLIFKSMYVQNSIFFMIKII